MKKLKLNFKGNDDKPAAPKIIMDAKLHLLQESRIGLLESGAPFYVLKFEMVTDINGMMAVLNHLASDGSINAQVTDGKGQEDHNDNTHQ